MLTNNIVAPKPEVQHLPTIFRQIANGLIRIPPFQRGFVWSQKQVLELLESLYNGFPVGSILLWNVSSKVFKNETSGSSTFPNVDEKFPAVYVLDGMQRLSSLYGVFFYEPSRHDKSLDISFEFDREKFVPSDDKNLSQNHIRLSALFNPRQLMEAQSTLASRAGGDALMDKTVRLYSVFQEYLLPTVTITDRELSSVVKIFERINSTGTRLSTVDFMRASTWSQAFDLTVEISSITDWLESLDQRLPQETIVKTLAIALGVDPTPDNLLNLRDFSDEQLHTGIDKARAALASMLDFLNEEMKILSFDYVAYEAQLLAMASIFIHFGEIDQKRRDILRRWLWSSGIHEGFRGRPDDFVTRSINELDDAIGQRRPLLVKRATQASDFIGRPFQRKAALSSSVAAMFAMREARSLLTGELIPLERYMTQFSANWFHCLIDPSIMREVIGANYYTARLIANIGVEPDRRSLTNNGLMEAIISAPKRFGRDTGAVLASQFICEEGRTLLVNGQHQQFLQLRAERMLSYADILCAYEPAN